MSRKRKIWVVVSLVAALLVLIPLGLRWRAQWNLNAYRKKLIASGEKLTVEELAPKGIPSATNTALFLQLASTLSAFGDFAPAAMHPIKPGVARVAWRQPELIDKSDGNGTGIDGWPPLADAALKNNQAFEELQALLHEGGTELMEDYSKADVYNGLTYFSMVKILGIAFSARAMLALHQGRMEEAFVYLKSCDAAAQLIANNPLELDQLVSYACVGVAAGACWEALQADGWTDDQLAQLQQQWDGPDFLAAAEASLAMERARGPIYFQSSRASRQGLDDLLGGNSGIKNNADIWQDLLTAPGLGARELFDSYPRYWGWRWIWSYRDEQRYLEFMQTMIGATRDAQQRRSIVSLLKDRSETPSFYPPSPNILTWPDRWPPARKGLSASPCARKRWRTWSPPP